MRMRMSALLCSLFLLCPLVVIANTNIPPSIEPPTLVPCKSAADCDQDPKHLDAFVAGFYRWYESYEDYADFPVFPKGTPREVYLKEENRRHEKEERVLKQVLTPEFYAWRKESFHHFATGFRDPRYCSPDINPINCSQDGGLIEWKERTSAQLIAADPELAVLVVTFPNPPDAKELPNLIAVNLKPHDGYWRLSGTVEMLTQ